MPKPKTFAETPCGAVFRDIAEQSLSSPRNWEWERTQLMQHEPYDDLLEWDDDREATIAFNRKCHDLLEDFRIEIRRERGETAIAWTIFDHLRADEEALESGGPRSLSRRPAPSRRKKKRVANATPTIFDHLVAGDDAW